MHLPSLVLFSSFLFGAAQHVSGLHLSSSGTRDASAPQPGLHYMRKSRSNHARFDNPLIASRQVQAGQIRSRSHRAKRACPSFLPNGNCACPVEGTTYCSDVDECIDIYGSDIYNCGGCGNWCGENTFCSNGVCGCLEGGYSDCYGDCVNLSNDNSNCGSCDNYCGTGADCINGNCVCDQPAFPGQVLTYCDYFCADLTSDNGNCGSCYNGCGTGSDCVNSNCVCDQTGYEGFTYCLNQAACFDLTSDPNNCGECGSSCGTGSACENSNCVCPIQGQTYCNNQFCADLSSDSSNCGACYNGCGIGADCANSNCVCDQPGFEGFTYCPDEGSCQDTTSDSYNCGACGISCGNGGECVNSVCVCTDPDFVECGGNCVNPTTDYLTDSQNCGSCGNACAYNQQCSGGTCFCDVANGYAECNGGTTCVYGDSCDYGGLLGVAYTSAPTAIVCFLTGSSCTSNDVESAGGFAGVIGTDSYFIGYDNNGDDLGFAAAVFWGEADADSSLGSIVTGNNFVETPAGSAPASSSGRYYETDIWTIIPAAPIGVTVGTGRGRGSGDGYPLGLSYVNGAGATENPLITLLGTDGSIYLTTSPAVAVDSGLSEVILMIVNDLQR